MSDLISTWRRTRTVLRLHPTEQPRLVEVEPLEMFSVLGRATDGFLPHLDIKRLRIATDWSLSGSVGVPTSTDPANEAASKLLEAFGVDLQGAAVLGTVFLIGLDPTGQATNTPDETLTTLDELGYDTHRNDLS